MDVQNVPQKYNIMAFFSNIAGVQNVQLNSTIDHTF